MTSKNLILEWKFFESFIFRVMVQDCQFYKRRFRVFMMLKFSRYFNIRNFFLKFRFSVFRFYLDFRIQRSKSGISERVFFGCSWFVSNREIKVCDIFRPISLWIDRAASCCVRPSCVRWFRSFWKKKLVTLDESAVKREYRSLLLRNSFSFNSHVTVTAWLYI